MKELYQEEIIFKQIIQFYMFEPLALELEMAVNHPVDVGNGTQIP